MLYACRLNSAMLSKPLLNLLVVYFLSNFSTAQSIETSLQDDYEHVKGLEGSYKIHSTPKSWHDAKQACADEDAVMFYPKNREEVNAAIYFWERNHTAPPSTRIFVGMSDIATEGVFETIDGKPISEVFSSWSPHQPDNWNDEDCVQLSFMGVINDIDCDSELGFICEKKLSGEEYNGAPIQQSGSVAQRNITSIPMDYERVRGLQGVYKFHTTSMNWNDAKQACADEDASLFYPKNRKEVDTVISFWERYQNDTDPDITWLYVGISDIAAEGTFETIDGKSISEVYNNWRFHQPDNHGDEDCVMLNQLGFLNDIKCDAKYVFICKKKLSQEGKNSCNTQQSDLDNFFRKDYKYIEAVESFYKIHTVGRPWAEAKRVCALEGATFWHPDNDDEADAVISFWNATQPHIGWVYVGLSDMMAQRLFETVDGKSVSEVYKKWLPNQPDNHNGKQHCVYMYNNGYMDDYSCPYDYSFICKKTLQSLEWNSQCNMPNLDYTFDEDIGKCYKLHTTPLNWTEAYTVCRREQSHLAVISNHLEAEYLANLTQSTPNPRVKENYQRGIYHVGFHNQFNEGWQTVTGAPMDVDAGVWWESYKPADDRAQCGSMFYTGRLINTDCAMKSFFICEHDINSS